MPTASPARILVVFNVGSGRRDRAQALADIEAALRRSGRSFEILQVEGSADLAEVATRAAREAAGCGGILAAAGGDGTLSAVAQAALEADVDFGAIPLGTFNYFARDNGIPLEPGEAAAVVARGVAQPVQVGLINDRVFLVNASLGLYPLLLEDREAFKQAYGRKRWVALLAALWTLAFRTQPKLELRIATGGEARTVRVSTLFVGNNPLQLARLGLRQAQAVEAGQLAAIRVRPSSAWRLLDILLHGAVGRLGAAEGVESFAFREMAVTPARPRRRPAFVKVATDGESARLALPIVFRIAPRPLRLVRAAAR
jgi:diacylglycerol kinase family enzyme